MRYGKFDLILSYGVNEPVRLLLATICKPKFVLTSVISKKNRGILGIYNLTLFNHLSRIGYYKYTVEKSQAERLSF